MIRGKILAPLLGFNPAISVNGLFLAAGFPGLPDSTAATWGREAGLRLQEAEVQFTAAIDPYAKADLVFSFEDGAFDIEEAIVSSTVLSHGIGLRAGRIIVPIGHENTLHTHQLPLIERSLVGTAVFGEGLGEFGLEAAYVPALPFFFEVRGAVYNGDDDALFAAPGNWDLAYAGGLDALWDVSEGGTFALVADYQLRSKFKERRIKRRQFILNEGEVCKHYTFVSEGCLKLYKIDQSGKEHNLQFAIENEWISDLGSLYSETPSEVYIEAVEQSIILQIERKDLVHLYTHFPNIDRSFRVVIENSFIDLQKRMFQNISASAEERYLYFSKTRPNLFNRISNVQIASYLGVTPEFLSAIRKRIGHP